METKFYICKHCGNVIHKCVDSGVKVVCCGEPMTELTANTIEASQEKHLPVVINEDDCTMKVQVGSVAHPMTPEHHIAFIYLETTTGGQFVKPTDKPEAQFCISKSRPTAVYEFCNLHGLWKTELV